MLTREELTTEYGNVWVHFVDYYNKTFSYSSEDGKIWAYIDLDHVVQRGCFLPHSQCIKNLYFVNKIFVNGDQIYQKD